MNKNTKQNLLFCVLITMLGVLVNVLNTVVDRIAISFGQQAAMAGLYISFYAIGSLTSVTLSSALADVVGKRKVIVVGILFIILGIGLLAFSHYFVLTLVSLLLIGFGFGPAEAMSSALLTDENPNGGSRWMNISQVGFSLGSIIAPILTISYLSLDRPFGEVFLICGGIFLMILFLIFQSSKDSFNFRKNTFVLPHHMFTVLKSSQLQLYALMIFCYLGYESVAPPYIKQLFQQSGHTEALAASMISLFWGSMIVSRLIGVLLNNRELSSIKVFTAIAVFGILPLVFAQTTWLKVAGVILLGFGCGPVWPMLLVLAVRVFPQRSGSAVGVMMLCSTAGISLFPFLIGTLPRNVTITFSLCAVLGVLVFATAIKASRMSSQNTI